MLSLKYPNFISFVMVTVFKILSTKNIMLAIMNDWLEIQYTSVFKSLRLSRCSPNSTNPSIPPFYQVATIPRNDKLSAGKTANILECLNLNTVVRI